MPLNTEHTVLIIADDLTGAADSTAAFARQGFRTKIVVDVANWELKDIEGYDVVAFNTQTRNLPGEEGLEIIVPLARRLARLRARLLLKKIDSTFRGQVLVETRALLEEFKLERVVIAPAYPEYKRQLSRGALFVDGIPVKDTTYARHSQPPPSNIAKAIREIIGDVLVFSGLSTKKLPEEAPAGVFLPDIMTDDDLVRTARWIIAQQYPILPVGSAGLTQAFARFLVPPMRPNAAVPDKNASADQKTLFVVGSTIPEISNQVRTLTSTRPDVAVVDAANGNRIDIDIASIDASVIVLRIVRGTIQISHEEAATNLAETTRLFLDILPVASLVTIGGETSYAILQSLGIKGYDISPYDVSGLARGETIYNKKPLTYVAKPGGFSDHSVFAVMAEELQPRIMAPGK